MAAAVHTSFDFGAYLQMARERVEVALEASLGPEEPESLREAMRYSLLAGGKRLRPILCLAACELAGGVSDLALPTAVALEMVHTMSLIHDDLPAMDNDDLRRGRPTSHRVFGEAMAILAGDALLTLAFEIISDGRAGAAACQLRIIHELAHAIGTQKGMVGGQVIDMESNDRTSDSATLDYIHSAKTGAFIRMAARAGAIYAQASEEDVARVTTYGEKIGLAFQIVDDLLDVLGSQAELGKTIGKDAQQHKATYPALHGIELSKQVASRSAAEACAALEPYGERARILQGIAQYLIVRTS